ncbi:MAG: hypothetical protein K6A45_02525 [Lachnospiraceae bacterium]|nr:hypothetical protein [Lachnospiraceae bacterium]
MSFYVERRVIRKIPGTVIDADSINYSPSRTFTDSEIRMLLDQIRRGF